MPHADPQLFAEDHAGQPLHQLAAGPARQLAGAAGLPGARRAEFSVTVDLTAEMAVINPFDFFVEPYAETLPFAYRGRPRRATSPPIWRVDDDGPLLRRGRRGARAARAGARSTSWSG